MDATNTAMQCQSCGMPLIREEDFATNENHTQNREYCIHCFKEGKFIHPDFTVEDQIELVTKNSVEKFCISYEQARLMAEAAIPKLDRWKHNHQS